MSDCCFGVSPVNYPDPDPDTEHSLVVVHPLHARKGVNLQITCLCMYSRDSPYTDTEYSLVVVHPLIPGRV